MVPFSYASLGFRWLHIQIFGISLGHPWISCDSAYRIHEVEYQTDTMIAFATFTRFMQVHAPPDSETVMGDGTFWDNSFEQDRSWDDSGTTISGI